MAGDFDDAADMVAEPHLVAFAQRDVAAGDALALAGPEMRAPVASLIARLPPVWSGCQCVFQHLADASSRAASASASAGGGIAGIDHRGFAARIVVDQPE